MYGVKVYITPEDVIERLSDEDKKRFNQCVFTDVEKNMNGVTINCVLFNDSLPNVKMEHEPKYITF